VWVGLVDLSDLDSDAQSELIFNQVTSPSRIRSQREDEK
jgi:hypothetical protein